ncbi:MAG TPA: RICIN domain-containing protein [Candidatus Angelobacter sp.]|nr:RICIN domain-containing protein [Candidatus Angelobacter sp.]
MYANSHDSATLVAGQPKPAFFPRPKNLKVPAFFLLAAMFFAVHASAQTNWTLVWSDEFNGAKGALPDPSKWTYDTGGGGFGNGEIENYCAAGSNASPCDPNNPNTFQDGNGNLVIRARNSGGNWTSGRMKTQGLEQFQFGRIEARMKLPVADGLWPAFWMLGADIGSVGWPQSGEQDIMEWVQSYGPNVTSSHIHGPGYSGANGVGTNTGFPNGGRVDDGGFHVYGVVWSQNQIQFYRDNVNQPFLTITPSTPGVNGQWVFNQPFFILMNLAVGGGGFPGFTDGSTPTQVDMLVDYVRVYTASNAINSNAWYNVVNQNSGSCVDATGFGTTNGTAVQQWACGNAQVNQEWQFQPTDSGFFRVVNRNAPSEVWDVTNVGTANNSLIQLWQNGGGTNQQWQPVSLGNGAFKFVGRGSGRCLDVPAASTANGVHLQIFDCNGTGAQAWTLQQQP